MSELAHHYLGKRKLYSAFLFLKNILILVFHELIKFIIFFIFILIIDLIAFSIIQKYKWFIDVFDYIKQLYIPFVTIFLTSFLLECMRGILKMFQNYKIRFTLFLALLWKLKEFANILGNLFDITNEIDIYIDKDEGRIRTFLTDKDYYDNIENTWNNLNKNFWDEIPTEYDFSSNMQLFNYCLRNLNDEISNICNTAPYIIDKKTLNNLYDQREQLNTFAVEHFNWKNNFYYSNIVTTRIKYLLNILYILYKPWLIGFNKIDTWFSWIDLDINH
jgi:hypothetical protein